jgi:hypothetical protein
MLLLLAGLASGADKWEGRTADVEAALVIPAPMERIFNHLLDLGNLRSLFPPDCVGSWEMGDRTFGEGASAIVRYDMAGMHRRLAMTLTHAVSATQVDFDHLGKRGFITRWTLAPEGEATRVKVRTPLNPPPRPLRGYFYTSVQPEWQTCYARTLANLATEMAR